MGPESCRVCKGACCEELTVSPPRWAPWTRAWLMARGLNPKTVPLGVRLESRCPQLLCSGRCGIYQDRPLVCRAYPVGSEDCLEVINRRRTPDHAKAIKEASYGR